MSPEITVARATSQKRIEANRRNAQKSTGPRTAEGKSRSRFNGLKHGLTAAVPVIPGEDPAVYEARLEAMIASLPPRNQVELDLLGRVAGTTWSLERASRAEAAQISHRIRNEAIERERREEDEAVALGQRLFWDARGPWQAYPHRPQTGGQTDTLTSRPQDPADANIPALQIVRLERTAAGCQWLLDRWAELRARLEPGEFWTGPDLFKAIRLLGKQPLDAIDDPDVTLICLASAKLLPDGKKTDPFATIKNELRVSGLCDGKDEYNAYSNELSKRSFGNLKPPDAGAAREALRELIDRQTSRLKIILARNQQAALADAAEARDRLAFDPSPEGEKLRRYSLSAARLANQTIKTYLSVVCCPLSVDAEDSGGERELHGGGCLAPGSDGDAPFAERKATIAEAASTEQKEAVESNVSQFGMPPASFNAELSREGGTAPLRTEANADSSVVRRPLSVVAEEMRDEPERGAADGPVRFPQAAVASAHSRPAQILRTEANAVAGLSVSARSFDPHQPPASTGAPAPAVVAGSGPFDVRNRRFFGAQMSAARAAPAGTERTGRTNQRRAGSRKPTKRREQN
jgi:hypothetical protein